MNEAAGDHISDQPKKAQATDANAPAEQIDLAKYKTDELVGQIVELVSVPTAIRRVIATALILAILIVAAFAPLPCAPSTSPSASSCSLPRPPSSSFASFSPVPSPDSPDIRANPPLKIDFTRKKCTYQA